ncbi:MAG: hypothetical protein ACP5KV_01915 [Candidatus Methanomethylicaceae archaeon]
MRERKPVDYAGLAKRLKNALSLEKPPVAVKFLRPGDPAPDGFQTPGKE